MSLCRAAVAVAFLTLSLAVAEDALARGAATTGRLEGRVQDESGTPIAGAEIIVQRDDEQLATSTRASRAGAYWVPALPPGRYSVEVAAPGHAGSVVEDVDLEAGESLRLDFVLPTGSERAFSITAAPTLDTVSPGVPPALGPIFPVRLPIELAARRIETTAGAAVREPAGLGLERARLHASPPGSFRLRLGGADAASLFEDTLPVDPAGLAFEDLQVRDLEVSAEHGASLGGFVDAVPRWPGNKWSGRVSLGWSDDRPVIVPGHGGDLSRPVAPVQSEGAGREGTAAGGGALYDRGWLGLGFGREKTEPGGDAAGGDVVRDAGFARAAFAPQRAAGRARIETEHFAAGVERPALVTDVSDAANSVRPIELTAEARLHRLAADWVLGSFTLRADGSLGLREERLRPRSDENRFPELDRRRTTVGLSSSRFFGWRGEHVLAGGLEGSFERAEPSNARVDDAETEIVAAWVEDRWRLGPRATATVGVRVQRQRASLAPGSELEPEMSIEPRVGGALDVYGDGTWKLYGVLTRGESALAPALLLPGALPLRIDPETKAPGVLGAAFGSEQLVVAGVVLSGRLGYWRGTNSIARLRRFSEGAPFVLVANPGRGLDARGATELAEHLRREIEIVQLALAARLSLGENWELGGAYSLSRVRGALDLALFGVGSSCGLARLCQAVNGVGFPSALEQPHRLELYGSYRFAPGLWGAFVLAASEGTPFVPLREAPPSAWLGDAQLVPDPSPAGADARNDAHARLDLSGGWELPLGDRPFRVALELSAFDVFDDRKTLERWPLVGSEMPAFGDPVIVQPGRWLQLDVRVEF